MSRYVFPSSVLTLSFAESEPIFTLSNDCLSSAQSLYWIWKPSLSSISLPPISVLLIVITETSSVMDITFPSASTFWSPVVFGLPTLSTLPSLMVNVNSETTVYPLGAAVSSRVYLPSFRPVISEAFPVNSMVFLSEAEVLNSLPSTVTVTPSRSASSLAVSLNEALSTGVPFTVVLLILTTFSSGASASFTSIVLLSVMK